MRALVILLLLIVSHYADASAVICPDGITYTDSAANKCPAHRTGVGITSITETSAYISGIADAQSVGATAYHWTGSTAYPPGCTALSYTYADLFSGVTATRQAAEKARQKCMNWKTMVAGTGASTYGSTAISSAGSFSVPITGLFATTNYYTQEFFIGGPGGNKVSLMNTLPFTTVDSAPPVTALTGLQRYIRDDGSDGNDGLTDATAKLTLSAGCPGSLQAGTDCNLKTGDTWSSKMTISHSGLSTDYSVIRCYKMSGGNPYECESGDTKPILLGTMDQTKLTAGTEDYSNANYTSEGNTSKYTAAYRVSSSADYTEHKFIEIRNWRHGAIVAQGNAALQAGITPGATGDLHHVKFTGMKTINSAYSPVVVEKGVTDVVIRDSDFSYYNTCETQRTQTGASTLTESCNEPGWPGGITIPRGVARILIENNDIHDGFGEAMNCYVSVNSFSIWRGNRIAAVHSGGMYDDVCTHSVFENNIVVGSRGAISYKTSGAAEWASGSYGGWEAININASSSPTENIVWRNNLYVGMGTCFGAGAAAESVTAGRYVEVKAFGNTCVDSNSKGVVSSDGVSTTGAVRLNMQNNVVWTDIVAANICQVQGAGTIETFVDNHWSTSPSDTDCTGAGDTSGVPGLTVSTYATWEGYDVNSMPTFANAAPTAGAIKDTGTCLTGAMLTAASYGFALDNISAVLAGTITKENWVLENAYDANGTLRGGTCSKGAVE